MRAPTGATERARSAQARLVLATGCCCIMPNRPAAAALRVHLLIAYRPGMSRSVKVVRVLPAGRGSAVCTFVPRARSRSPNIDL